MEKSVTDDTWVIPCVCQELAEIAYFSGDVEHAHRLLKKAASHSGYVRAQ